jgi:oligoribonuclease
MTATPHRQQSTTNLVWMDLEMTGLDPAVDSILQAALIVTTAELEPLERYVVDIWQPEHMLERMVPFVRGMHEKTGLIERVRASKTELRRAEQEMLARVSGWCAYQPVLCGNTIHSDRKFLDRFMPALAGYLHYRMVDVSSLKVLVGLWYPTRAYDKPKGGEHDALFDIEQSIAELDHYRKNILRGSAAEVP